MITKTKKKFIVLITVVLVFTFICVLASTANAEQNIDAQHPLDSGKEILYYLFYTQDEKIENDVIDLKNALNLTTEQMELLGEIGLEQHQANNVLKSTYSSNSKNSIDTFNVLVENQKDSLIINAKNILGKKYEVFRDWIQKWWDEEVAYRNEKVKNKVGTMADIDRVSNIWATQYVPNTSGAMEVALPDKYLKFANLGWNTTYPNPPYVVNVYYPSTDKSLLSIRVDEVGPWNENDNYWDTNRRTWKNQITLGVPEAYEAYYNNFNSGQDEFGRRVTNPAGIDLSTSAAKEIGFANTNTSGWVDVRYEYLP